MNREAFLDKGERAFVFTVAFVLGVEVVFTIMATGQQFAWPRLVLGIFGSVFILYLAQRLYSGDRSVEKLALLWATIQIVLMAASLVVGPTPRSEFAGVIQDWGVPGRVMATIKLVAYALFAAGIQSRGSVRAFLAQKRGEDALRFVPATEAVTGAPITWTADQTQLFGSLAKIMQVAALVLILVGLYVIVYAIPPSLQISQVRAILVAEGFLTLALGAVLLVPARALTSAGGEPVSTTDRVDAALERLAWWHWLAGVVGLLLLAAVVARFLLERSA